MKVRPGGESQWQAFCPVHEADGQGHKPSLSVGTGDDGRVLIHCHAGCPTESVLAALGLKLADLMPPTRRKPPVRKNQRKVLGPIVKTYDYLDAHGNLLFQVTRHDDPKTFRQRRPDGNGGWIPNLNGTPRVLYKLQELLAADPDEWVFVVEGEKDVESLASIGLQATCNPGGAGKWNQLDNDSALHGRHVTILPDKDDPGRRHASDVASRLRGKATKLKIVELPGDGKDVSDWLDDLDAREPEELRNALLDMANRAPLWNSPEPQGGGDDPVFVCLADIAPKSVEWLWPERIALGKLTILAGDPGLGKSFVTLDMAAKVSTGRAWPDCREIPNAAGGVVLLSAEDDLADTIRPRLDAADADCRRIIALTAIRKCDPETGREEEHPFSLAEDLPGLEGAIKQVTNCRLVVIDPISAYMGRTDSHKNAEVRGVLAPLAELAARHRVAVVAVTHLRKGEGPAMYRTMGSLAFVAAARAAYATIKDKADPSGARRLVLPVKNNLGNDTTGLAYRLRTHYSNNGQPVVSWETEPVTTTIDEVMKTERHASDDAAPALAEAKKWLADALALGPKLARELVKEAGKDGVTVATLRRAKHALKVESCKGKDTTDGKWSWRLPLEGTQAHEP